MNTGNQYSSRKTDLWRLIYRAHDFLIEGNVRAANGVLDAYRRAYARVPESTRRRWKCGR